MDLSNRPYLANGGARPLTPFGPLVHSLVYWSIHWSTHWSTGPFTGPLRGTSISLSILSRSRTHFVCFSYLI